MTINLLWYWIARQRYRGRWSQKSATKENQETTIVLRFLRENLR